MSQQPVRAPSIESILGGGSAEQHPSLPMGPSQGPFKPEKSPAGALLGGRITDFGPWALTEEDPEHLGVRRPKLTRKGHQIWGIRVTVEVTGLGPHSLWIDGTTYDDAVYNTKKHALIKALKAAGATTIEIGGELYLGWVRQVDTGRGNPATDWAAKYIPAGHAAVAADLAPQVQPVVAQVATPAAVPVQAAPAVVPQIASPAVAVGQPPF